LEGSIKLSAHAGGNGWFRAAACLRPEAASSRAVDSPAAQLDASIVITPLSSRKKIHVFDRGAQKRGTDLREIGAALANSHDSGHEGQSHSFD
jgi:hypothetical protein